jgi:hypothetical protein
MVGLSLIKWGEKVMVAAVCGLWDVRVFQGGCTPVSIDGTCQPRYVINERSTFLFALFACYLANINS